METLQRCSGKLRRSRSEADGRWLLSGAGEQWAVTDMDVLSGIVSLQRDPPFKAEGAAKGTCEGLSL